MEELYAEIIVFAVIVIIAIVANVSFRRKIDKICQTPDTDNKPTDLSTDQEDFPKTSTLLKNAVNEITSSRDQYIDELFRDLNIPREKVYKWAKSEDCYALYYIYDGSGYHGQTYETRYEGDEYKNIEEGEYTGVSFYITFKSYIEKIAAPISGTFHFIKCAGRPSTGQKIAIIDPSADAKIQMENWRKERERIRNEEIERWAKRKKELEREEMEKKILERHRKRELEKSVRQNLIDRGLLYGEQTKRPHIPQEVVDAVYKRDGGRCVRCGSTENLQLDHIVPFSKGGATSVENLQLLCRKCNLEKSNKIG